MVVVRRCVPAHRMEPLQGGLVEPRRERHNAPSALSTRTACGRQRVGGIAGVLTVRKG